MWSNCCFSDVLVQSHSRYRKISSSILKVQQEEPGQCWHHLQAELGNNGHTWNINNIWWFDSHCILFTHQTMGFFCAQFVVLHQFWYRNRIRFYVSLCLERFTERKFPSTVVLLGLIPSSWCSQLRWPPWTRLPKHQCYPASTSLALLSQFLWSSAETSFSEVWVGKPFLFPVLVLRQKPLSGGRWAGSRCAEPEVPQLLRPQDEGQREEQK